MFRLDFNIACLTLRAAERLVDHNFRIRQRETFAARAAGKQERAHARREPDTDGGNVALDIIHSVVNRHTRRNRAAGGVDIKANVFRRVFPFEIDQLRHDRVCHRVVDLTAQKDDAIVKQAGI